MNKSRNTVKKYLAILEDYGFVSGFFVYIFHAASGQSNRRVT